MRKAVGPEVLQQALDLLVERHEVLRTRLVEVEGEPRQRIVPMAEGRVEITASDRRVAEVLAEEGGYVFDLATGPLLRVQVVTGGEGDSRVVLTMHHIITDEWSTGILLREWQQAYDALLEGGLPSWPALRIQYKDYAVWQRARLGSEELAASRRFWLDQFAGGVPVAELPADGVRPVAPDTAGRTLTYTLPASLSEGLRQVAAAGDASLFMVQLALVQVLLYKYTGERRVITGTQTLGREHPDLEGQVGFFVNTLPVVGEVDPGGSFAGLLEATRERVLAAYGHQGYPFDELVSELGVPREVEPQSALRCDGALWPAARFPVSRRAGSRRRQPPPQCGPAGRLASARKPGRV